VNEPAPLLPPRPGDQGEADCLAEFVIRVRVLPGEVPRAVRVKRWLKLGLRHFRIVNEGFVDLPPKK
jgi:hypothetical protein